MADPAADSCTVFVGTQSSVFIYLFFTCVIVNVPTDKDKTGQAHYAYYHNPKEQKEVYEGQRSRTIFSSSSDILFQRRRSKTST